MNAVPATRMLTALMLVWTGASGAVIRVASGGSIQDTLNVATAGDTIIVEPGTYLVSSRLILDKAVVLASDYILTGDEGDIDATVLQADTSAPKEWFRINADSARVVGLRINGNTRHTLGIFAKYSEVVHCKLIGGGDLLSFERGGGYVGYCYLEGAGDDDIDCDESVSWTIEHCTLVNAYQDGIEVRLQPKAGPLTTHVFRYNTVVGSGESGIQLINYPGDSYRQFEIYGNVFKNCGGSGVSCMHDSGSVENYRGSDMEENAFVYNNTFDGCRCGITLAPTLVILNNIFTNCGMIGIERGVHVTDSNDLSIVDYCDFYGNTADHDTGISIGASIFMFDPAYADAEGYALTPTSPCIDRGIASYEWNGSIVLSLASTDYHGSAPDLGARESDWSAVSSKRGNTMHERTGPSAGPVSPACDLAGRSLPNVLRHPAASARLTRSGSMAVVNGF
jgi:hypothetical protein